MPKLDELESRLQSLLEVHLVKYLPGYKAEDKVAHQLAEAMQGNITKKDEETLAPNVYTIVAHPSTLTRWNAEPRLLEEMAEALFTAGAESGFQFSAKPTVSTAADTALAPDTIHVLASFTKEAVSETRGMPVDAKSETPTEAVPHNAFLILGGTKIIPLNRSVMNIGRRLDNHIVIDDPRVSRAHAQLRVIKDRFILFDLNSTGGTFVNGERANQAILYPGDVISLAGVTLIFGQDLPGGRTMGDAPTGPGPAPSISADRPTAILPPDKAK
jgi:pSer/pThr/pTyr-binding forkhead associated (FHA) protein